MIANIYDNLEDCVLDKTTNDVTRKAKKKLRKIEALKMKSVLTDEEQDKIRQENYWKIFVPSGQKFFKDNYYNITHSFREQPIEKDESCPICLNPIWKNMGIVTDCKHTYCNVCITHLVKKSRHIRCSLCRSEIQNFDFHDQDNMFEIMKALSAKQIL
uniref:RING-type domain-containing protein n=1 Tax=viral metagenome TaxID=1070528 RepID=A0A6C0B9Z0_9ZZZZ